MSQSEQPGDGKGCGVECWICLDGLGRNGNSLQTFCSCSMRQSHATCQMRWQLSQLQRSASTACRFCGQGSWEATFGRLPRAQPTVKVEFGNRSAALVSMKPGPRGMQDFQEAVRRQYNIHPDEELFVSFQSWRRCEVGLEGWETYDTVVLLAQMQAAARVAAAPLPPVVLPPADAAVTDLTPTMQPATASAASSPVAAAAIANLGLQLPIQGTAMDGVSVGAGMETVPLLQQGAMMSAPRPAGELLDGAQNEPVIALA